MDNDVYENIGEILKERLGVIEGLKHLTENITKEEKSFFDLVEKCKNKGRRYSLLSKRALQEYNKIVDQKYSLGFEQITKKEINSLCEELDYNINFNKLSIRINN